MAPDQCIFVPMMCNTIYEKKKIFAPQIYRGGYLFDAIFY